MSGRDKRPCRGSNTPSQVVILVWDVISLLGSIQSVFCDMLLLKGEYGGGLAKILANRYHHLKQGNYPRE